MFNLGVETGQIAFVTVVALALATFWTIQRLVGMLPGTS